MKWVPLQLLWRFTEFFELRHALKELAESTEKECVTDENVAMREECSFRQICRMEVQMQFTGQFCCVEFVT